MKNINQKNNRLYAMFNNYNRVNLVAVIIMFITTTISLIFLPNTVIVHFNGIRPDQTGSKYLNLLIPVIGFIIYIIGTENLEAKLHIYSGKLINIFFFLFAELNLWWTYLIFKYANIKIPLIFWICCAILIIISYFIYTISLKKL